MELPLVFNPDPSQLSFENREGVNLKRLDETEGRVQGRGVEAGGSGEGMTEGVGRVLCGDKGGGKNLTEEVGRGKLQN